MKYLLLLLVLITACAPKPEKVYTEVEIGMYRSDFERICGYDSDKTQTHTNSNSETRILFNESTEYNGNPRPSQCIGRFTFIDYKLDSITR